MIAKKQKLIALLDQKKRSEAGDRGKSRTELKDKLVASLEKRKREEKAIEKRQ